MKKLLLGAIAIVGLSFGQVYADPVVINISGAGEHDGLWEVSSVEGSFSGLQSLLESQVWWGNESLALIFAETVFGALGIPNFGNFGPSFAHGLDSFGFTRNLLYSEIDASINNSGLFNPTGVLFYAVAERPSTSVPEPTTLGLFGVGLFALGYIRSRRKISAGPFD